MIICGRKFISVFRRNIENFAVIRGIACGIISRSGQVDFLVCLPVQLEYMAGIEDIAAAAAAKEIQCAVIALYELDVFSARISEETKSFVKYCSR